jgi:hypothetical protein
MTQTDTTMLRTLSTWKVRRVSCTAAGAGAGEGAQAVAGEASIRVQMCLSLWTHPS